ILKLVLIILPVMVPVIITGDLIVVDTEEHYKEINVKRGVDFTLRLKGSGWYLNRYDTGRLDFKFRVAEPGYTDFTIRTSDEGQAYLFFSYLDKDLYVLVNIKDSLLENNSTELQENTEDKDFKKEIERGKKRVPEKAVPGDAEIYYVGKDKKVIKVPDQNEDAEYKKGIQLFNDGLLEKALMSFMDYLSNCESCLFENDALFKIAEIYIDRDDTEAAIENLNEIIESGSQEHRREAYLKKAGLDYRAGRLRNALDSYRAVLEYDGGDTDMLKIIGDIYYQLNNHEKALTAYLQVIDKGLAVDEVYFRVAFIYDSPGGLRDLEKAFRFYMIITEKFISSEHYQYSKQRVKFFEKNFFRYE
ncbi:MAG: tetratricopeptide repeat protein, partial [Spirochaetes bacterium]|nr:tetratricopeptide repeat protein [Spirochaetota bacterium]